MVSRDDGIANVDHAISVEVILEIVPSTVAPAALRSTAVSPTFTVRSMFESPNRSPKVTLAGGPEALFVPTIAFALTVTVDWSAAPLSVVETVLPEYVGLLTLPELELTLADWTGLSKVNTIV